MRPISAARLVTILTLGSLFASPAHAHIKMLKPTSWIVESAGGDPQKNGPCGPAGNPTLTNAVTTFQAGETITVEWTETIRHPGWFRIALAEKREDLKDPAIAFDGSCNVDHTKIPIAPHDNVLADGILIQKPGDPARPGAPNHSHQVTLPSTPCEKCTLQLIQFMENHAPGCIYYHCADIKIVAASGYADAGASDAGQAGTSDAAPPGAAPDGGPADGGTAEAAAASDDAGCECSVTESPPHYGNILGMCLTALLVLLQRRRSRACTKAHRT